MTQADRNYMTVMFEEIIGQNKIILDAVGEMQLQVNKIPGIEEDIAAIKSDVASLKFAVTDISKGLRDHDRRISKLESAVS